mgnify:CR=1 FL=1
MVARTEISIFLAEWKKKSRLVQCAVVGLYLFIRCLENEDILRIFNALLSKIKMRNTTQKITYGGCISNEFITPQH